MLFWEEPVVSAFVRACAAALARVEIDHVHDVSVSTKHECIHLIYSCRWFFCTSCASVDEGTLFRIDRCWVYSSTVQDPRPLVSDNDQDCTGLAGRRMSEQSLVLLQCCCLVFNIWFERTINYRRRCVLEINPITGILACFYETPRWMASWQIYTTALAATGRDKRRLNTSQLLQRFPQTWSTLG